MYHTSKKQEKRKKKRNTHNQSKLVGKIDSELKQSLEPIGVVLISSRRKGLNGGDSLGIQILSGASHDGQVRLSGGGHVDPKESETVGVATGLEHGRESHDLARPVHRARHVEALGLSEQARAQLVALGQLVVEGRHGPEHQLLEGHPRRELSAVHERETVSSGDEVVVVVVGVLEEVGCVAGQAGEEWDIVVADNALVVVVLRDAVVDGEDRAVRLRKRDLAAYRRVRDYPGDGYGRGVRPAHDVVHVEG